MHSTVHNQSEIGWKQMFNGELPVRWLTLQGRVKTSIGKVLEEYIWGASMIEVLLWIMIELLELRNKEINGKEENKQ